LCRTKKVLVCPKEMEHNSSLFTHPGMFVIPVLQFFAIPDYCFEELQVPKWVYDRRRSLGFKPEEPATGKPPSAWQAPPAVPPAVVQEPPHFVLGADRSCQVAPPQTPNSGPDHESESEEVAPDVDVVISDDTILDRSCASSEMSDRIRYHTKLGDNVDEISATLRSLDTAVANSRGARSKCETFAFDLPLSPRMIYGPKGVDGDPDRMSCICSYQLLAPGLPRRPSIDQYAVRSPRSVGLDPGCALGPSC